MSAALRRLVLPMALFASFFFASFSGAQAPTVHVIDSPTRLRVANLPDVLRDDEVARHLDTGLTATLVLEARVRGHREIAKSLRIDVRYELWDEVYFVETSDPERRGPYTLDSAEALSEWWTKLTLDLPATPRRLPELREVDVSLSLVPFSEAERRDTELWYSGSARSEEASAAREGGDLGGILELVTATSIRREATLRYDWRVEVGPARAPDRAPPDPP